MKAEKEHIDELIVSYLSNELDGNAVHELKEWIAASVENEKYLQSDNYPLGILLERELEQDYAPYTGFRAFKERNIYGCNTGKVDFYEDSPFHPDRLLKDLIKIFHPTLLEGYELKYFTKLAE